MRRLLLNTQCLKVFTCDMSSWARKRVSEDTVATQHMHPSLANEVSLFSLFAQLDVRDFVYGVAQSLFKRGNGCLNHSVQAQTGGSSPQRAAVLRANSEHWHCFTTISASIIATTGELLWKWCWLRRGQWHCGIMAGDCHAVFCPLPRRREALFKKGKTGLHRN